MLYIMGIPHSEKKLAFLSGPSNGSDDPDGKRRDEIFEEARKAYPHHFIHVVNGRGELLDEIRLLQEFCFAHGVRPEDASDAANKLWKALWS